MIMKGLRLLIGIIVFGSLWGALEATLGGALANFPRHGAVMANIGFLIMAAAVALYKRPGMQLGIGMVAASFKLLDVVIFHVPPLAQMIVNPMMAIIMEALAFELAVGLVLRRWPRNIFAQAGTGALGVYLAYVGIALGFLYLTGRGPHYVLSNPGGFVLESGGVAAMLALVSVPLGSWLGGLLGQIERLTRLRPRLLYSGAAIFTLLCWLAAVWGTLTIG